MEIHVSSLNALEIQLIKKITKSNKVVVSYRAIVNYREYHCLSYDNGFENINSNTIEYLLNGKKCYGIITLFLNLNSKMYCIIKKLQVNYNDRFFKKLSDLCLKHVYKFFMIVNSMDDYTLIECKTIVRPCILMEYIHENKNETMLMPCENLDDCD